MYYNVCVLSVAHTHRAAAIRAHCCYRVTVRFVRKHSYVLGIKALYRVS